MGEGEGRALPEYLGGAITGPLEELEAVSADILQAFALVLVKCYKCNKCAINVFVCCLFIGVLGRVDFNGHFAPNMCHATNVIPDLSRPVSRV